MCRLVVELLAVMILHRERLQLVRQAADSKASIGDAVLPERLINHDQAEAIARLSAYIAVVDANAGAFAGCAPVNVGGELIARQKLNEMKRS